LLFLLVQSWVFGLEQAVIPFGFVSPENGLGLGVKWITRNIHPNLSRLDIQAYGTTRSQFELKLDTKSDQLGVMHHALGWRVTVEGNYYPDSYFGRGSNTQKENEHVYMPLGIRARAVVNRWLFSAWRGRLALTGVAVNMLDVRSETNDSIDTLIWNSSLVGYQGGLYDLLEGGLEWDTRDEEELPTQGLHIGSRLQHSLPGSEFDFAKHEEWGALYFKPGKNWETAFKIAQRGVWGNAPFMEWPALGDRKLLRGVPRRRLRDRNAQTLQAELRYQFKLALPIIARHLGDTWQIATFGELGRVANDLENLQSASLNPSGGMGGRLIVGQRLGVLRGDLGFSRFGFGIYIDFNQAF